jgi:GT2 family glycosyltransferase
MNKSGKIGVVTVTYNSGLVLGAFLQSLVTQTHGNFLVYVVDNASQDTSIAQLKDWADGRLRVIANEVNVGIAEGNNQGTRAALSDDCDYVLYLNNDVEFEPETFANLVAELEALDCDLLAPKIFFEDRTHIWSAGGAFNALKGYLGSHRGEGESDRGQYDTPMRVNNAPGCCLLVRNAVFNKIGMMDAKYFVYHEDADFLFRAWRAGLTMFYTPRARIFHKVSALTGGVASPFSIRYNARGHVYFMLKNLGVLPCLFYLPALQLRMAMKVLLRSISWGEFIIRQRAFFEGIAVWASGTASDPSR